jgi:hypothetical protein
VPRRRYWKQETTCPPVAVAVQPVGANARAALPSPVAVAVLLTPKPAKAPLLLPVTMAVLLSPASASAMLLSPVAGARDRDAAVAPHRRLVVVAFKRVGAAVGTLDPRHRAGSLCGAGRSSLLHPHLAVGGQALVARRRRALRPGLPLPRTVLPPIRSTCPASRQQDGAN